MLIKKSNSIKIDNTKSCTVWEYEIPSHLFSFAIATINGRYPTEKRVVNLDCEEIYYVLSGSGEIHSEKGNFKVNEGDIYHFEKGEIYWTQGNNLKVALINAPKWSQEQHKIVD
jgi:mannose-6-phosphate isomerase-like protein (cupin superfamily)